MSDRLLRMSGNNEVSDAIYAKRWWTLGTLCVALIVILIPKKQLRSRKPSRYD